MRHWSVGGSGGGGGGGTPGGVVPNVQYQSPLGSFAGKNTFNFTAASDKLTIGDLSETNEFSYIQPNRIRSNQTRAAATAANPSIEIDQAITIVAAENTTYTGSQVDLNVAAQSGAQTFVNTIGDKVTVSDFVSTHAAPKNTYGRWTEVTEDNDAAVNLLAGSYTLVYHNNDSATGTKVSGQILEIAARGKTGAGKMQTVEGIFITSGNVAGADGFVDGLGTLVGLNIDDNGQFGTTPAQVDYGYGIYVGNFTNCLGTLSAGIRIASYRVGSGVTNTNATFGLLIDNQLDNGGADPTNDGQAYAIYTGDGLVRFGDDIYMNTDKRLHLAGSGCIRAPQTGVLDGRLFEMWDGSGWNTIIHYQTSDFGANFLIQSDGGAVPVIMNVNNIGASRIDCLDYRSAGGNPGLTSTFDPATKTSLVFENGLLISAT